jgi:hypothetical protein
MYFQDSDIKRFHPYKKYQKKRLVKVQETGVRVILNLKSYHKAQK